MQPTSDKSTLEGCPVPKKNRVVVVAVVVVVGVVAVVDARTAAAFHCDCFVCVEYWLTYIF